MLTQNSQIPDATRVSRARFWFLAPLLFIMAAIATAQTTPTYELVHAFRNSCQPTDADRYQPAWPTLASQSGLVLASDGFLYGTSYWGGASGVGAIFRVNPSGGLTIVHSFAFADGANPAAALVPAADGNLYGTTTRGGSNNLGTVFRMDPSGAVTRLHSFASPDGTDPRAALIQASDSDLYGTTSTGGTGSVGTLFKIDSNGTFTKLHDFDRYSDGAKPTGRLLQASDGYLYGTTFEGGANNLGTVFRVDVATNSLVTLHVFGGSDGASPYAGLIQATDGNLYGTSSAGGSTGYGIVYRLDTGGTLTSVYNFKWWEGGQPYAELIQGTDLRLYSTTSNGGPQVLQGGGMIYQLDLAGNLVVLHNFNGRAVLPDDETYDGLRPLTALVQAADGSFYGTTDATYASQYASVFSPGTVFRLDSGGTFSTTHVFRCIDGADPKAALTQATDGSVYGTTYSGGASSLGTAFKLNVPTGEMVTLHTFAGAYDGYPGQIIQATDGNFYGTTPAMDGSVFGGGSLFRMDTVGELTTLYRFAGYQGGDEGSGPTDRLIQATDGLLYGTTLNTKAFKVDEAGNLTYLRPFADCGLVAPGPLVQWGDGFYGIADSSSSSVLFKMDSTGAVTPLHYLNQGSPVRTSILVADGDLFGNLWHGWSSSNDAIFKTATDTDDIHVIHTFDYGDRPFAPLVPTTDQWLYGTTQGADSRPDAVFRMDYDGQSFTLIHSFTGIDGGDPVAGLIQAADGRIYGTAGRGPFGGHGVIFRLSNAQIAVNNVAPSSSVGQAGAAMTILGGGFVPGVTVTIGGVAATDVTVADSTFLHLLIPALSPGTYDVTVTAPGGAASATLPHAFVVSAAEPPTITGLSPTSGSPSTHVTVNGSGFAGATAVTFNGVGATSFTVNSDNSINATVPPGGTTGEISVTTPAGTAFSAMIFTFQAEPPAVTGFSPAAGPPGAYVTISGSGFTVGVPVAAFNGLVASEYSSATPTKIVVRVPWAATTGKITVTTLGGTATSGSDFLVGAMPTIASFTPTAGPIGGKVTIDGTGFTGVASVKFNGKSAAFSVLSQTQLSASVNTGTTSGKITVTTPTGTATSATDFTVVFPPTVTGFSPGAGPAGTAVVITGTNFDYASLVTFNNTDTTAFTINSPTQITVNVPAAATSGKVKVTNPAGRAQSVGTFLVLPTITSFSPTSGLAGTRVVINGTTFNNASSVQFNGLAASFMLNSTTKITATVPSGVTAGPISVTTPGGTATSATNFLVLPTITGFDPRFGPIGGKVTINGTDFTGVSSVKFNGRSAAFNVVSSTQLIASVNTGTTSGKITVTTPAGTATSAADFIVVFPPTVTGFTPASGPAGTKVVVTGTNFDYASVVTFNNTTTTTFTINSPTQITVNVPAAATSGKVKVTNPAGRAQSVASFLVTPTITSFTPASGRAGASVVINGTTFNNASSVKFNGVTASFMLNSTTKITATVPAGATTGKISVTTPGGTANSATNFTVLP